MTLGLLACSDGPRLSDQRRGTILSSSNPDTVSYAGTVAYRREEYTDARQLWQRAVDLGYPDAFGTLGYLTYYGLGGPEDHAQGIALWQEGARRGAAEAHTHLARVILTGDSAAGTLLQGYAHAVAGERLAAADSLDVSPKVARQFHDLGDLIRARLSEAELKQGDSFAAAWLHIQ